MRDSAQQVRARLIPEDRRLSPLTGWTRDHWTATVNATVTAVRPFASPGHALIDLPGSTSVAGRRSDGLEGFARTFLAAGFALATVPDGSMAQWYAQGIAAGVDPASAERWPSLREVPQAKVEAASIALALHESRHVVWDALPELVREQVVAWLADAVGQEYPACNWVWFRSVVEAFLRSVGGPWSAADLEATIEATESWYVGNGWYTDGFAAGDPDSARNFDWYAGWAMHVYPLWYCRMSAGHTEPALATRYRDRLRAYLTGVRHLYAPDGAPLHQGRSLTYRYAALAPVWAGAIFDASPLTPGATRRLASGVLRHFGAVGAWNDAGLHPIGWYGAFDPIRQPYSGPGSPYWSSKGFAGLVLPADHPVWTDVEEPLAVEGGDVSMTIDAPGWLVSATRADGVVRVVNHGTDHQAGACPDSDDPGYARLAYSTAAGPDYDLAARQDPTDNHVALVDRAGAASHRGPLLPLGTHGRVGISQHQARWLVGPLAEAFQWPPAPASLRPGPVVTCASVLRGAIEVRVVRVEPTRREGQWAPEHPHGRGPLTLRIGGFAIADDNAVQVTVRPETATATARRADGLTCVVTGLRGLASPGAAPRADANPFGRHSAVPLVTTTGPVVRGAVYAAAVVLSGDQALLATLPMALPEVTVASDGSTVQVRWADGVVDPVVLPISAAHICL